MTTNSQESTNEKHLVNTYVSDMVALMQHINAPLDSQLNIPDATKYAEAISTIQQIKSVTTSHMALLDGHLKSIGGSADHGVKSAFSQLLGAGAAAVNHIRDTKVSKALRDDYTALSLSAISYTMLHATALGVGDSTTAQIAKRGLDDVAPLIVKISKVIPTVVLQELQDDGEPVKITAAELSKQTTGESWSGSNTKQ